VSTEAIERKLDFPTDDAKPLAEAYIDRHCKTEGEISLRYWGRDFWRWDGAAYRVVGVDELEAKILRFLATLRVWNPRFKKYKQFSPSATKVREVVAMVGWLSQVEDVREMPAMLDTAKRVNVADVMAFPNGLLDVAKFADSGAAVLRPPTPLWFSSTVLPYEFAPAARCEGWLSFLNQILDEDPERVALLQEWFGYNLTADTGHQKMLMMVGPPRSGKGTITRTMTSMVGEANCASAALSSLGESFGLEGLVGKTACICSDAHLGDARQATGVLEMLKRIVGEDRCDVNRKNKPALTSVRLFCRFTIAVNTLPQLKDPSNALGARLLMLGMDRTFKGREDLTLGKRIAAEMPGILRWAMEGLVRLRKNGKFTRPGHSEDLFAEFERASSYAMAFVEDCCVTGPEHMVARDVMYEAFKRWWAEGSAGKTPDERSFGRELHSALKSIGMVLNEKRPRLPNAARDAPRPRFHTGIGLKDGYEQLATQAAADKATELFGGG
jgi:putative DNA primase/helicase